MRDQELNENSPAAVLSSRAGAMLTLLFVVVLIQFGSGLAKTIMMTENAAGLALFRTGLASALLWLAVRPKLRHLGRRAWRDIALLGVFYAVFNLVLFTALVHLPIGLVVTIGFLGPLGIALAGARRALDAVWPLLGFAGVYLLAPGNPGAQASWASVAYGLLYALAWAAYILAMARAGRSVQGLDAFVIAGPIATLIMLPIGYSTVGEFLDGPTVLGVAIAVSLVVAVAYGLEFLVLQRIEPRVFGVLLSAEPAVASIIGMLLLQEFLSFSSWLATGLVTVAALGVALTGRHAMR